MSLLQLRTTMCLVDVCGTRQRILETAILAVIPFIRVQIPSTGIGIVQLQQGTSHSTQSFTLLYLILVEHCADLRVQQ